MRPPEGRNAESSRGDRTHSGTRGPRFDQEDDTATDEFWGERGDQYDRHLGVVGVSPWRKGRLFAGGASGVDQERGEETLAESIADGEAVERERGGGQSV